MSDDADASDLPLTRSEVIVLVVAGLIGFAAWWWTTASAPRFSDGAEQDMGNGLYLPLMIGAAIIGGWLIPARAGLIGLALGAPGMLLAPWTAPRGDNDGLWIMIIPFMVVFTFVLALVADLAGRVRRRLTRA